LIEHTYHNIEHPFCQAGKEKNLKIHIDFPGGGWFDLERPPMERDRFYALCYVVAGALVVSLLLGIVYLLLN